MIKPKKSLGQNFLIDNNILNKIIKLAEIENADVVEIGPGTGNLTKKIIEQKPKKLILIEKDQTLSGNLKKNFKRHNSIKIFNEDILKFDLEKYINTNSIIVGNLPYNISSQILVKLIKFERWLPKYKKLILMFQKEVADKILAKYNTSNYGRLSVLRASRLKVTSNFNVSPNSFWPVPKVKSTVVVFEPIINGAKSYSMKIYDRWGGIIYTGENQAWDGKNMPSGQYFYSIKIIDYKNKIEKEVGQVTLVK